MRVVSRQGTEESTLTQPRRTRPPGARTRICGVSVLAAVLVSALLGGVSPVPPTQPRGLSSLFAAANVENRGLTALEDAWAAVSDRAGAPVTLRQALGPAADIIILPGTSSLRSQPQTVAD